ncbi:hypothetical protein Sta7437_3329 [Stanieria cyanosphaera PCC 7437]|uniref:DUF3539 family protein n=1 Tax=Stanieria cyanosphaera (strain ATCC 29371 / PCC 7437) TaxID=111780 RepID=K9XW70_STAC7|nr:PipX family protein [Stanieria cyanosphaera]AFZ36835.1 hypothetical protein Sta7437_3329 [Stanieria cyanosphaera PCC 7437]
MNHQSNETYLNHPTFGLLYRICLIENDRELFTTLYAQRLFFIVVITSGNLTFEPISRSDARLLVENRLRKLRQSNVSHEYQKLNQVYQQTFQ